jgi:hypothetical protein
MSDQETVEQVDTHASEQQAETEAQARRLGWVPKEEFRGDPAKHRSAEEFLERGKNILPIVQENNDRLQRRVSELESTLKETREATKELLEFSSKAEERAYKRAKQELEARIEQAAQNADPAAARQAVQEMAELEAGRKTEPKRQPEATAPAVNPVIQDWIDREKWYSTDRTLNAFATDTFGEIERSHPGMSDAEKLAETKRRTVEKFPEKFGVTPQRRQAAAVATPNGGGSPSRSGKKSYDDLPADAKAACDKFVRTIPGYTRDQYVKDYAWE